MDQAYLDWFSDLSTERLMEGGHIPASKIREYARHELEMNEDLVFLFTTVIRELDLIYLKLIAEQREKTRRDKTPSGKKPPKTGTAMKTKRTR